MTTDKIIIIDDEQRMCDSLTTLLRNDGYDVLAFQDSRTAVESIRVNRVDLVITDIKMPDMDGLTILREVKKVDGDIPVILMTGYASLETALDAIGQGAYDYLLKPVEFTALSLAVRRALERRHGELERLRLLEELKLSNIILQRRVGELNALYEAGKQIGSAVNLKELLRQIVALAATVTEAQRGSIMLLDRRNQFLTIEAAIGLEDDVIKSTRLPIGSSIAGHVAKTGEPLMVADVENDKRFQRINQEKYGAASLLCTPLRIKNIVLGVINMSNKSGGREFTQDDLRLLTNFASQAAIAVDDAYEFERNRRRLIEFEILHEMLRELNQIDSFDQFRHTLVEKLRRVFPVDWAVWLSRDGDQSRLVPQGVLGSTDMPLTDSGRIDLRKVTSDQMALTVKELDDYNFDDILGLSELVGSALAGHEHFPTPNEAFMAVPIVRNGLLVHLFCLGADDQAYSDDDLSLARLVIGQSAVLFEKEKALLNATRLITMGNMISEISHDLRRPLTNIKGSLQVLSQRLDDAHANPEIFEGVNEDINHMNDLVRELVDFSKPNKYETSRFDLRELIGRAIDLASKEMVRRKIECVSEFAEADWEVVANRNQMIEVFLNILLNAIEAMPDGGKLRVQGLVECPIHKKAEYLAVRVIDTGEGINKENLSRIFDRYFTTKTAGTGLGLAVVERIIAAHNGTLAVKSEPGKGTNFTVYLPLNR